MVLRVELCITLMMMWCSIQINSKTNQNQPTKHNRSKNKNKNLNSLQSRPTLSTPPFKIWVPQSCLFYCAVQNSISKFGNIINTMKQPATNCRIAIFSLQSPFPSFSLVSFSCLSLMVTCTSNTFHEKWNSFLHSLSAS